MELRFYIKKRQLLDLYGNPIIAVGNNPSNLGVAQGTIPNNNWIDITDDVDTAESFSITFTENRDNNGNTSATPGVKFYKKAASGSFMVTGSAYNFIYDWIYNSPTSIYNSFSLKVEDVGCGVYDELIVSRSSIEFCESNACRFSLALQQADEVWDCIQKTIVSDNWQGWFQEQPIGKKYPRFSYCNEPRNSTPFQLLWFLFFNIILGSGASIINLILMPVLNPIIAVVNIFAKPKIPYLKFNSVNSAVTALMFESAGCGREHPAPFIRDYIKNVCDKCNVDVDAVSAPIFFATHLTMTTAGGGINNATNPHYNATWLEPKFSKGVRRYKDLWHIFLFADPDNTTYFQPSNGAKWALSDFLDMLKPLYNAEWRIRKVNGRNTLFFLRKDWFKNGQYVYNFQEGSSDRDKIMQGVCFTPQEVHFPASVDGIYQIDPIEQANTAVLDGYNGLTYSFGQLTENNALYDGYVTEKQTMVAPTKFALDGSDHDYIYDAFQISLNSAWFHLLINAATNPLILSSINSLANEMAAYVKKYVNHCIYLQGEYVGVGRVIIWDGNDLLNARAMKLYSGAPSSINKKPEPPPLQPYNKYNASFNKLHHRQTFVRGLGGTLGSNTVNAFEVRGLFSNVYLQEPCELPNFPMYFNPGFRNTLWDWFWFIEDPRFKQKMGIKWSVQIENCCEDRDKLGVYTNSDNLKLGYLIKLPLKFIFDGVIDEIEVNYSSKDENGRTIKISGTV